MPILNYTTSIDPHKSLGEIQKILVRHGVSGIRMDFDGQGNPKAVTFQISVGQQKITFKLPANVEGVYCVIQNDRRIPGRLTNRDQARRIAWRIIKDWVEAQVAIIEAGQAKLHEVFLPYMIVNEEGMTAFQQFEAQGPLALNTGNR